MDVNLQEVLRDQNIGVGLDTKSLYGGGGEPAKTRSGNVKTRFPTTMKRDIYGSKFLLQKFLLRKLISQLLLLQKLVLQYN